MQTVIIVIHLLIVLALVGVVLLQRSEGGGLGGGGGGVSGFMTGRGQANALDPGDRHPRRLLLPDELILASWPIAAARRPRSSTARAPAAPTASRPRRRPGGSVLDQLRSMQGDQPARAGRPAGAPQVPQSR